MAHVMVYGEDENKPKFRHLSDNIYLQAGLNSHTWDNDLGQTCMTEEDYAYYAKISQYDDEIKKLTKKLGKVKAVMAIRNCQRLNVKDISTYEEQIKALTDAWQEELIERRMR